MTTVKATFSVNAGDVDSVMSKLIDAGFDPKIDGQRHSADEHPNHDGVKLVLISFKNMGGRKSWRLVEYFLGHWTFEGYEFECMDKDDFEIVCWYDLPEEN